MSVAFLSVSLASQAVAAAARTLHSVDTMLVVSCWAVNGYNTRGKTSLMGLVMFSRNGALTKVTVFFG